MDEHNKTPRPKGRPKGSENKRTWFAREWAEKIGVDPIEFLTKALASSTMEVAKTDAAGKVVLNAKGKPEMEFVAIPLEVRIDCAKALARYMYPVLQAVQITGKDDGPVEVAALDLTQLLDNPQMLLAAETLSLALSGQGTRVPQPGPKLLGVPDALVTRKD